MKTIIHDKVKKSVITKKFHTKSKYSIFSQNMRFSTLFFRKLPK